MRIIPAFILLSFLCSLAVAQSEPLPDILKPDVASELEARRMGAQVFKLLPRGMFPNVSSSQKIEKDNPLGVRGGGAYYSFATGSHSYNKTPQIELQKGNFSSGFGGMDYGFFVDLGAQDLTSIDLTAAEAKYFFTYRSPVFEKDILTEHQSVHARRIGNFTTFGALPAVAGHTYLLRALNFDEADTLVALQVLRIDSDGATTIAWKKLADFGEPFYLYMTDEELQNRVNTVISEEKLSDITFTVKDNRLNVRGTGASAQRLNHALGQRGIRFRGGSVEIVEAQRPSKLPED